MDFTTLQKKMKRKDSNMDLTALIRDIKQIFENCYTYNFEGSLIYTQAQEFEEYFFQEIFANMATLVEEAKIAPLPVTTLTKAVPEPILEYHLSQDLLKKCRSVLRKISAHKCGFWFRQPVN